MKITRITLTNFRSFNDTQSVDIAPVTLLFGPNSVGKSSILMALAYVQQILQKGHCNPQRLDALGKKTIGGFQSLVHGQDLKTTIKIRLDFSPDRTPFVYYGSDVEEMANRIQNIGYVLMEDFGGSIECGAVELEIAWSERFKRAFVNNYRVWANGAYVGCVNSSEDLNNTVVRELNTQHPLLVPYGTKEWLDYEYGEIGEREELDDDDYHTEFEKVLNHLNPNPANTAAIADVDGAGVSFTNRVAPISLSCRNGAIPLLGVPVMTNLIGQGFDELNDHFNFLVIRQVLSQAFVLPLDKLLEYFERSVQIGPLRVVPDNNYIANPHPEQADWVDGSAAWDLLYRDPTRDDTIRNLIRNTNDWLSSADKLNSGYEIVNQSFVERAKVTDAPEVYHYLSKRQVFFRDIRNEMLLSANQLGTGISQVLPIVVAANYDNVGLVSIEQPELHIHPRFQVELADIFLKAIDKHSFLIETHSEHLVLRLLRRIRQNTDNELPDGYTSIKDEDVSVTYLEPSDKGVITKRIRIDQDGEFIDRWPNGFFVERREELL